MSLQEDFPAKTSVWQGEKKESQRNPDQVYFTNSSESYAWYDRNTLSWKTWQRSLITDWTSFSGSWPKQGSIVNGRAYLRVHWEPVTDVRDGGVSQLIESLPTPTASDVEGGVAKDVQFKNGRFFRENKQGVRWGVKLRDAVSILPTPRAGHGMNMRLSKNMAKLKHKKYLETEIAAEIHENLPTPTAREWKDGSSQSTKNCKKQESLGRAIHHTYPQNGENMYLNPCFVEEMMGYEIGWTDLDH